MTDIVERLRMQSQEDDRDPADSLLREAADEIERLNALVKDLIGRHIEATNEIERLWAEVELWKERYEAERRDHEATMRTFEREFREFNDGTP